MKLHSYAINSARVDRLYSGNNCLESIRNKIKLLMDMRETLTIPLHILGLSEDPDLNRISFSRTSFYHNKTLFLHYSTTGMLNSYSIG